MKMHKLMGDQVQTYCSAWLGKGEGFWASRWWKYVTCKRCVARRAEREK